LEISTPIKVTIARTGPDVLGALPATPRAGSRPAGRTASGYTSRSAGFGAGQGIKVRS